MYTSCSTPYLNCKICFMFRILSTYPFTYMLPSSIKMHNVTDVPLRLKVLPFEEASASHYKFFAKFSITNNQTCDYSTANRY